MPWLAAKRADEYMRACSFFGVFVGSCHSEVACTGFTPSFRYCSYGCCTYKLQAYLEHCTLWKRQGWPLSWWQTAETHWCSHKGRCRSPQGKHTCSASKRFAYIKCPCTLRYLLGKHPCATRCKQNTHTSTASEV